MGTTGPIEFDEGYNKHVIELPVLLPKLFDFNSVHAARVTVDKLSELYQTMYSFTDQGDPRMVPTKVKLPVLHSFDSYNEENVTVGTLQSLYKVLYQVERGRGTLTASTTTSSVTTPQAGSTSGATRSSASARVAGPQAAATPNPGASTR